MAHLRRLLCCSSLALVAAKRRSPSERTPERRGPRRGLLFAGDADPERYYNASWTPGPPQAWNSTRRLTSTNLIDPAAHAVTSLPGLPADWAGNHYAGMIDSDDKGGGRLFYGFFERDEENPAGPKATPLLIWLNGGPGSSSLLGFMQEAGPLLVGQGGALVENPWSWTKVANVFALEAPGGVGFSYCEAQKTGGHCGWTDKTTAKANANAVRDFFVKFPELADNDFFITGESYAGVYCPTLARELVDGNDAGAKPRVNLVGMAVGDPCTDNDAQKDSMDMLWYGHKHGFVPDDDFMLLWNECGSRVARDVGLPNADRKDSQGICFLGKVKFSEFVAEHLGEIEGAIVELETGKRLGTHKGFWFHTIGQRSGLRLSGGPWYVAAKDVEGNVVYATREYYAVEKKRDTFEVGEFSWVSGAPPPRDENGWALGIKPEEENDGPSSGEEQDAPSAAIHPPMAITGKTNGAGETSAAATAAAKASNLFVKVRHGENRYGCTLRFSEDGTSGSVVIERDDQGLAAGQFAVFYEGETCLGCGVIAAKKPDAALIARDAQHRTVIEGGVRRIAEDRKRAAERAAGGVA